MHGIIVLNDVGAGFTPAQTALIGQPQWIVPTDSISQNENDDTNTGNAIFANGNQLQQQKGQPQLIAPTKNATVGDIVGAYKSLVANGCLDNYKTKNARAGLAPDHMGKLWQRNYHEHIIRNEQSYQNISNYIINNPAKWNKDKFYKQ